MRRAVGGALLTAAVCAAQPVLASARLGAPRPLARNTAASTPWLAPNAALVPLAFAGADGRAAPDSHPATLPLAPLWTAQRIVAADGLEADLFGFRVLVTGDTAFVSAPAPIYRPGKVYVYQNVAGTWTEVQQIVPTPTSPPPPNWSDFFGWSLSRSGDTLLVGAPFMLDQTMGPIGGAYVFTLQGGSWTQTQELRGSDSLSTDYFGWAVALSGDTAVVGANSHNRGANGTEGAAYVFVNSGGTWSQTQQLVSSDSSFGDGRQFGSAIEFDGTTLVISSPSYDWSSTDIYLQGAAYVFNESGGSWTEVQRLQADDGVEGDQFGYSLALDGTRILVGAPAAEIGGVTHQGAVYAFENAGGTWSQTQKLTAADGVAYDQLGQSVALRGDLALAGMWSHDDNPNDPPPPARAGMVHVFQAAGGTWAATDTLVGEAGTSDSFGWDVDLDGTTLLVGSQETVGGSQFQGAAYFFAPDAPPVAGIAPGSLSFTAEAGGSAAGVLTISNTGGSTLDYAIAEEPGAARRVPLAIESAGSRAPDALGSSGRSGPRAAAPWRAPDGDLSFVLDDGTYEDGIGLNDQVSNESAAIWLNRFTPPAGTGAFTIDTISILWPQNTNGTLVGKSIDLLAYYDADGDGDPSNAVRLGSPATITVDSLDAFVDYTVNFAVPGDGDVYVGFENVYALGGSSPILFPAAIDEDSGSAGRSWVAGMGSGDPDADVLGNNDLFGTIDSFGLAGNWLIRATGAAGGAACTAPADVPWLSESPSSGSIAAGTQGDVAVAVDASALAAGSYSATICVTTNDPDHALIAVPVSLTVTAADRIFADGFEAP